MREAFGGTYMIYVFIIFVALYIVFIALVLNYVQSFKVKNQIINYIEQYECYDDENVCVAQTKIREYIGDKYAGNGAITQIMNNKRSKSINVTCDQQYGYCVYEHTKDNKTYYSVETFIAWDFPLLGLENMYWTIKGETRILAN